MQTRIQMLASHQQKLEPDDENEFARVSPAFTSGRRMRRHPSLGN
jgi:hypothetical protein